RVKGVTSGCRETLWERRRNLGTVLGRTRPDLCTGCAELSVLHRNPWLSTATAHRASGQNLGADLRKQGYPRYPQALLLLPTRESEEFVSKGVLCTTRCFDPDCPSSRLDPERHLLSVRCVRLVPGVLPSTGSDDTESDDEARQGEKRRQQQEAATVKIRVERDVLAEAVAWAARSLPARPPAPVLAGLLLKAEDGQLSLSSFDYEVSARVSVEAEIEEEGTVLVSGRLLADISRALPNRPVEISTDGVRATVVCGSSRFTLHTLPVEEYPALPQMPNATGTVAGEVFASAVQQVAIAAGRDDTLPVLTGVRIEIEGDTVTLASTDRYRFAVREFLWKPENPEVSAVALVPAKTLQDTAKALTSGDQVILALSGSGAGEGLIGFEGAGRRTTTRLLEGDLPKYRTLFPTEFNSVAVIETAPFVEAVKRVALVAERN